MESKSLYVVQNSEGKFFHRKGRDDYGDTWTSDFTKARIYTLISQARARVTFFIKNYPDFPAPKLMKLAIHSIEEVS